jgi:hypothetical protein
MSLGSNGVDRVRSLRKIKTILCFANLGVMALVRQFCIDIRVVTKQSETPENMSFGSNGVDRVRSLRKKPAQLHLANLCVNGNSSASFSATFVL